MATIDKAISAYIALRDSKDAKRRAWEQEEAEINEKMDRLQAWLKNKMLKDGVRTSNTKAGTAFFTSKDQARISDFDSLIAYIKTEDKWELLERRVSKNAVKALMDENTDGTFKNSPPPGVDYLRWEDVQINRPRA